MEYPNFMPDLGPNLHFETPAKDGQTFAGNVGTKLKPEFVRRWNSHTQLLEACRIARNAMSGYEELSKWLKPIKAAIEQATT